MERRIRNSKFSPCVIIVNCDGIIIHPFGDSKILLKKIFKALINIQEKFGKDVLLNVSKNEN